MISIDSGLLAIISFLATFCFVAWLYLRKPPILSIPSYEDDSEPEHVLEFVDRMNFPEKWECMCGAEGSYLHEAEQHALVVLTLAAYNRLMDEQDTWTPADFDA